MQFHFPFILLVSALVPLIVGFIWYNPKVFGNAWLTSIGKGGEGMAESMKEGFNMPLVFGLSYVFGLFLSLALAPIVIHEMGFNSMMMNVAGLKDASSEVAQHCNYIWAHFGDNFRTFKHGAFHGIIAGITFALPVIAINAMFERRNAKYIAINAGFWTICLTIMGAIICQFM